MKTQTDYLHLTTNKRYASLISARACPPKAGEQIFYGEFDGQRKKRVLVKVIGE